MKKLFQKIKLRRLKTEFNKDSLKIMEGEDFLVWFTDNTCKEVYCKDDLIRLLEKDHIKRIRYVFDMTDRIIVQRDIYVEDINDI